VRMPLSVQKRIAIHAPSFPIFQLLRCFVRAKSVHPHSPSFQCPRRNSPLGRYYSSVIISGTPSHQNPPTPTHPIHSMSPVSTKIKTNRNPRTLTGPQSYLYPLPQLTIFPRMSCVVAEPHVVLTEKEGRRYHYPYSGICGAVRLGLGPSVCEVHTKVRTKVCTTSENLRRNQLKGAEQ
jgi:hypothetical protein